MTALGAQYPRFGYRRIGIFLGREGHGMRLGTLLSAVAVRPAAGAALAATQAHRP
jgi:hypothetical protein